MSQTLDSTAQVFVEATSELLRLFLELRPGGARPTAAWEPCGDGPTIQHRTYGSGMHETSNVKSVKLDAQINSLLFYVNWS